MTAPCPTMTDEALQRRVEDLEDKVERLRAILISLLDRERKSSQSEVRRLKNLIHREEEFALLCEDLAASVT